MTLPLRRIGPGGSVSRGAPRTGPDSGRASRAAEALQPAQAALDLRRRMLVATHPDVAASELELAAVLADLGRAAGG